MRMARALLFAVAIGVCTADFDQQMAAQEPDFHAVVERDGTVVLCLSRGQLLFGDRCTGAGALTIVQPIQDGPITWRTVSGTVISENAIPQNPDCALSRARWNPKDERAIPTGKYIRSVASSAVMAQLDPKDFGVGHLAEGDFKAFELDLDNDGQNEIVFTATNLERVSKLHEEVGGIYHYVALGGILRKGARVAQSFHFEEGDYEGGTDAIGWAKIEGIVPIAVETGEVALLLADPTGMTGMRDLIRYRGQVQRIQTIQYMCN